MIHKKCQDLFSMKFEKKKIIECRLLQILLGILRVNPCPAEPGYTLPLQTV